MTHLKPPRQHGKTPKPNHNQRTRHRQSRPINRAGRLTRAQHTNWKQAKHEKEYTQGTWRPSRQPRREVASSPTKGGWNRRQGESRRGGESVYVTLSDLRAAIQLGRKRQGYLALEQWRAVEAQFLGFWQYKAGCRLKFQQGSTVAISSSSFQKETPQLKPCRGWGSWGGHICLSNTCHGLGCGVAMFACQKLPLPGFMLCSGHVSFWITAPASVQAVQVKLWGGHVCLSSTAVVRV